LLISGGTIVDGTGNPGYRASLAVDAEIVRVIRATASMPEAVRHIDASGLIVAPGFIDLHSHAGLLVLAEPDHFPKVSQGVTTEVIGVDGNSYAPFDSHERLLEFVHMYAGLDGDPDLPYDWDRVASYLSRFDNRVAVNVALVIGNSALRLCTVGWEAVEADSRAIADMRSMLREGMQEGAVGLSTGLDYPPGSFASTDELIQLAQEAGRWGGFYHTHLRNTLGDRFLDPIREAVQICHQGELPLHLTHLFHRADAPGGAERIFDLIDSARATGVEVTFDTYPYEWGSTTLLISIPQWAQAGGPAACLERLRDPAMRARIRDFIAEHTDFATWTTNMDHLRVGNFKLPDNAGYEGLMLGEVARMRGQDPVDAMCDLLVAEDLRVNQVAPSSWGVTMPKFVVHPDGMVGTDSIFLGAKPSPRTYGSYPRILGEFVREEKRLSLPEAIRKMTSYPAQRLGLLDRGILRDGMRADITIFDLEQVRPVGTYDHPRQQCRGIEYVMVNGTLVMDRGRHTGAHPGRALRGSAH
jgi:N-acyl-D-amino-acid deacylase